MAFVAFQAMRGPGTRQYIAELMHDQSKAELLAKLSNIKCWESFVNHMRATGQQVPLTREQLLEYAQADDYKIEADKTWTLQQQIRAAITLMPVLAEREWSLFTPADGAPDFICSDCPVCVTSKAGETDLSIGFCKEGSCLSLPLGRRHALVGVFEGQLDMQLPEQEVAALNAMTMQNARWIYSAEREFTISTPAGDLGGPEDLLKA